MKPNIGIDNKKMKQVTTSLANILADIHVLYIKTRFYHWNVRGQSFMELHVLFETQYKAIEIEIDEVAERISKLGEVVPGSMNSFLKLASLKESAATPPSQVEMIKNLLNDHETVIKSLRTVINDCEEKYEDKGTADLLTGFMKEHETIAWKLRRYID